MSAGLTTAVILAAGQGRRMGGRGLLTPKGLMRVGGQTLISRSMAQLRFSGVTKFVVVVGHLREQYIEAIGGLPGVVIVENEDFGESGSMKSLFCVRGHVSSDFLLTESDIVYESRALEPLVHSSNSDVLLTSGRTGSGDEVWVQAEGARLVGLSKRIEELGEVVGELVGLTRVSSNLFHIMCGIAAKELPTDPHLDYEHVLARASRLIPVTVAVVEDLVWGEIDTEEQEARVTARVLPRLDWRV
jgi:2-aminoethylphosphonate-pyruvate transaminase